MHKIVEVRTEPPFFQWASGLQSPLYMDFRRCLAYPELRSALMKALVEMVEQTQLSFVGIAGVATGGISWAAWLADRLHRPMGYVRSATKSHGKGRLVEGLSVVDGPLMLIEDVVSTGQSLYTALQALKAEGFAVSALVTLWDYRLSARLALSQPLHVLLSFPEALLTWQTLMDPMVFQVLAQWYEPIASPL